MDPEAFYKRFEEILISKDFTRRDLARELGCTGATIGRWLRGEVPYSFQLLARLHEKYNIDLNWLLCGQPKKRN